MDSTDESAATLVEDAHDPGKRHAPIMTTADLGEKWILFMSLFQRRFYENFKDFEDAFARAWFKINTQRYGSQPNYLGRKCRKKI